MKLEKLANFESHFIAVFNSREYDQSKGREAVIKKFGVVGWRKVLDRKKSGIMEIFHHDQIPETLLYVETVAQFADRRYGRRKKLV